MNRFAGLGFLVFLLGCAQEGVGIGVEATDTLPNVAPRRSGGQDAGSVPDLPPGSPDTLVIPDTIPTMDTRVAPDVIAAPDALSALDVLAPLDSGAPDRIADATPISDVKVLPDGLSYPHDIAPNTTTPCMQQVIDNGYASDKASCATWNIKLNEDYIANTPTYTGPRTALEACMFIIDCFAAKPDVYTNWYKQPDCNCTCPIPFKGSPDWTQLMEIVSPFCPTFFQTPQ